LRSASAHISKAGMVGTAIKAMAARNDPAARRIGVCIAIADQALAQRMSLLLSGDVGLDVVLGRDDRRDPDVFLADHAGSQLGPSIIIDDGMQDADAWDADVRAILPPGVDGELLRATIRVVAAGFVISEADELHGFSEASPRLDRSSGADNDEIALTSREGEVLALLARGASNKSIARALDISVHTAKFHVASVLAKLGARNRSDAVAIGIRRGLVLL
jgi:DNA-binding CsgD family transcriptional regulator